MDERLLTEHDVARWLSVAQGTVTQWRIRGQGPPFVKLGRAVRYRRADVESWIARRANRSARDGIDPHDRTSEEEQDVERAYRDA